MKQRIVAGFNVKPTGIVSSGNPMKCTITLPEKAILLDIGIDARGNMVAFADVWSHPEGTKVNHKEIEIVLMATNQVLPPGSWDYYKTLIHGPAIFHVFMPGKLKLAG